MDLCFHNHLHRVDVDMQSVVIILGLTCTVLFGSCATKPDTLKMVSIESKQDMIAFWPCDMVPHPTLPEPKGGGNDA